MTPECFRNLAALLHCGSVRRWVAFLVLMSGAALVGAVEDDMVVDGPIVANGTMEVAQFGMGNFDQMLYQNDRGKAAAEERIRARVELQLAEIEQACQLSEAQKQKLQLAVRGELQRLSAVIGLLRAKYEKLAKNPNGQVVDPFGGMNEAMQSIWQEIQALQLRMNSGLTDRADSLFMKVVSQTLTAEQRAKYDVIRTERQQFRYEANIAVSLHNLEDVVYFSEAQREAITKLLLAMPAPRQTGQYEMQIILIRIGMIPAEKLQPLFSPVQWRKLDARREQYRQNRQAYLQSGLLDPEDVTEPTVQEKP